MSVSDWIEWTTEELIEQLGYGAIINGDDEQASKDIRTVLAERGIDTDDLQLKG